MERATATSKDEEGGAGKTCRDDVSSQAPRRPRLHVSERDYAPYYDFEVGNPNLTSLPYRLGKKTADILMALSVLLLSAPIIAGIFIYIRRKTGVNPIFRQIRMKRNRRRLVSPTYMYCERTEDLLPDQRVVSDYEGVPDEDRRCGETYERQYYCPRERALKPDRREFDLKGEPFTFYKFRTMDVASRDRYPELYNYRYSKEEVERLTFKLQDDPRVPEWAQWLRKTSLDELPNMINVLRGDMSMVGPRPDIPEMTRYYGGEQRAKLLVQPGVTGLAQIYGRGDLSLQETLAYDVEYVRKASFLLDARIVLQTLKATLQRDGAF